MRSIEDALGMSTGYLTRILSGQIQLRLSHVLGVCDQTGLSPGAFFVALYPPARESSRIGDHPPARRRKNDLRASRSLQPARVRGTLNSRRQEIPTGGY